MNDKEASTSDGNFHGVQPHRDLQSNWEVDLVNKLQSYLLKICSGEFTGQEDSANHLSVNFAEAALLIQGSVQVYSKKIDYLYSLVVHALEFISQHGQQHDQPASSSGQDEEQNGSDAAPVEPDDTFWCSNDIPVDAKNSLDTSNDNDAPLNSFVKPPANLVVLEGDCLDVSGDSGELESFLLATNDLHRDFLLLDASDAVAVDDFLGGKETFSKYKSGHKGGSSIKSRKSFMSPSKASGGTVRKQSAGKTHVPDSDPPDIVDNRFDANDHNMQSPAPACNGNMDHDFDMEDGFSHPGTFDDSDEDSDDPWKPLNPHERGNLKVKPFKKVKAFKKNWPTPSTKVSILEEFPLAKLHGPISAELNEIWDARYHVDKKDQESESLPLYEKLRRSLVLGDHENLGALKNGKDDEDNGYDDDGGPDFMADDYDMPDMNEDHFKPEKHVNEDAHFDDNPFDHEDPDSHANLEDLCRSHMDSLLASIAETEKQTALAARVSNWKQRIEQNLDEQDARPPFDIHEYGQRTLDKLSLEADVGNSLTFTDVVRGQEKHDVARTFSALLQLVNNGNVELVKCGAGGEFICYTAENPFHVRLLNNEKRAEVQLRSSNKRPKAQLKQGKENRGLATGSTSSSSPQITVKLGKGVAIRCTPESKRRRRSRMVDPDGLSSAG
uniref:condensin-2 complex subunit H2 n=1 Tax=Erigeron canadensis TaxID=72917 RepID=UPI001CB9642C|nr:condensin-2 complex subunit H2 [Erigeron canadensis]